MLRAWLMFALITSTACSLVAQTPWEADPAMVEKLSASRKEFNYRESNVPEYSLPDPLRMTDGTMVTTPAMWPARREETMQLFRSEVYGHRPATDCKVTFTTTAETDDALGMGASGRALTVTLAAGKETFEFPVYVFFPSKATSESTNKNGKAPAVIHINNREFPTFEKASTVPDEFWPLKELLSRGYVACAVSTVTIDPDRADGFNEGVRGFFHRTSGSTTPPKDDAWKALSAWGWGASRALDYLLTLDEVDGSKVAVIGHSRGGKASLWAAAEDTRFAIPCSNNSGCGGAALSRRAFGETVARITTSFPHWFCDRFSTYSGNESKLPVDQHQLFGLMAPRPVYATSASADLWADPRGEYLSMVAAAPVYKLHGLESIETLEMPALSEPRIAGPMGYHIRPGEHGLTLYDWSKFLDFCDGQWQR